MKKRTMGRWKMPLFVYVGGRKGREGLVK